MSHAEFFGKTANQPGDSAPLQPRFGVLQLLTFHKTQIVFEMEEISDCRWDSGKYDGAADGDWENCVRSQGTYFEGVSLSHVQCSLYLVSSLINVSIFHILRLDALWTDRIEAWVIWLYLIPMCLLPVFTLSLPLSLKINKIFTKYIYEYEVCPESIQPYPMKERDIYWRRYKVWETLYTGQWLFSLLQSRQLRTSHSFPNPHQLPHLIFPNLTDGLKYFPFQR